MEKEKIFLRTASGLVRNISGLEAMIANISFMGYLFVSLELTFTAGLYPGVHIPTAAFLVIPFTLVIATVYGLLTVAMPRTGGDYVFVGRILHPALGFMVNFYFSLVFFSWFGSVVAWIPQYALSSYFASLGAITGDPSYAALAETVMSPVWSFAITAIFILIGILIVLAGPRTVVKAAWTCFIITLIGLVVYATVLLGIGHEGFVANFNALSGTNYEAIISAARAIPDYPLGYTLSATLLGTVFIFLGTLGYTGSAYCAGEVKGKLTHLYAMLGAVVLFGVIVWPIYFITPNIMGHDFINALCYLAVIGDPAYTLPVFPSLHYLAVFATQNIPILTLIHIAFIATTMASCAIVIPFLFTRNLFAWSFDRLLPSKVAAVDKRGNPWVAVIITLVAALISNYITHFTHAFDYLAYSMLGWFIATSIVCIAAAAFPYLRKDLFEASPPVVKRKLLKVPLLTIFGVIGFIISIFISYATISPAMVGILDPTFIVAIALTLIAAPIYYALVYLYWKRKGIPIQLAHKVLPPE
jgi:amino acid transporter